MESHNKSWRNVLNCKEKEGGNLNRPEPFILPVKAQEIKPLTPACKKKK